MVAGTAEAMAVRTGITGGAVHDHEELGGVPGDLVGVGHGHQEAVVVPLLLPAAHHPVDGERHPPDVVAGHLSVGHQLCLGYRSGTKKGLSGEIRWRRAFFLSNCVYPSQLSIN